MKICSQRQKTKKIQPINVFIARNHIIIERKMSNNNSYHTFYIQYVPGPGFRNVQALSFNLISTIIIILLLMRNLRLNDILLQIRFNI